VAALSIRNLDDDVKKRLRIRAAKNGRSMESEIRAILVDAVSDQSDSADLFEAILDQFAELGGVDLELPARAHPVRSAELS
jgi:plasmid stability protein